MAVKPAAKPRGKIVRCGVIGYSMGTYHARFIAQTPGLRLAAICDVNADRRTQAAKDYPGIATYSSVPALLRKGNVDLAAVVTPHDTHARLVMRCANAGKHVVVDKPMCITIAEADRMIQCAKDNKVMLSVFHNRRWDGDFMTLRDIIRRGIIGDVFHIETFHGGYERPGTWWRSDKRVSGGAFHDWGAHYVDWVLHLAPGQIESIMGYYHKLVWSEATIEDQVRAVVRFDCGAVADLQLSSIAAVGKDRWRILGTKGGIRDGRRENHFLVSTEVAALRAELEVPFQPTTWEKYYQNIADHLLRGAELAVKPEQARRVISVMETAERSAKAGKALKPRYT